MANVLKPVNKKRQLETDLERISHEMYRRNLELAETNQTLSLLRAIDTLVLESHKEIDVLCQDIAAAIIGHSHYPFVAMFANHPHKDYLEMLGWSTSMALKTDKTYIAHIPNNQKWLLEGDRNMTVDLTHITDQQIAKFLQMDEKEVTTIRQALPLKSLVLVKLSSHQRMVGLMAVGFTETLASVPETDVALLDHLAEAVGVALDNQLLLEENKRVVTQLRTTNKKLKDLDEAKDDFISMASHQLRTPLTSVKGYISMVMEEDAGKVTKVQKDMLGQAFFSSQRMVYLISDLLNVSRLKTGKFVIEPALVNLADVVEQELDQLQETAASRTLKLIYNKPKDFPDLMLDETKIRQVIMNFVDNAIYYTPAGGQIEVKLLDVKPNIELRVEDNGIGVPKSEQPHLFTKFYRAGNARKARPDGTGLGLFMAKKVITAEGGALIFESLEGKGSTFGFTFNKSKLSPAHVKPAAKPVTENGPVKNPNK